MFKLKSKLPKASLFFLALILMALFYGLSLRLEGRVPWHQRMVIALIAPLQESFTFLGRGVAGIWNCYFDLVGVGRENEDLRRQNDEQKIELIKRNDAEAENGRLRQLLGFKERHSLPTVGASVIANDPRSEFRVITVDKGAKDGIEPNMPVVAAAGLVGRVADVAGGVSRVLLITDPNNAVDVMVERSRARAILIGTLSDTELKAGYYLSRLEYLERKSDIVDGDTLISSGLDGLYPRGIPVGVVKGLKNNSYGVFKEAEVVPFVDLSNLEEVLIVTRPSLRALAKQSSE